MADLKVGAPLACDEFDDDWNEFSGSTDETSVNTHQCSNGKVGVGAAASNTSSSAMSNSSNSEDLSSFMDSFLEKGSSGSLEDLVHTFDKTLSECFSDYKDNIANIAPVQVRSQEEIINGCQ